MLDLNIDAGVDFVLCEDEATATPTAADSVGSTTTTSAVGDEVGYNSSLSFGKDVIHNDDEAGDNVNELQLFPMGPSSQSVKTQNWLNLSAPEVSTGGGAELGIYKNQLPITNNQVPLPQAKKSRRGPRSRSSQYRGVTFYRRTGRWESHIWDCGKQVYLGGFDTAHAAARAYDRAAIMFRGVDADINFSISDYDEDMKQMKNFTKEQFVQVLRRQSTGLPRGNSKYRGAASLQKCTQWQLLEKKPYEKLDIQLNERVSIPVTSNYIREVNFGQSNEGSGSNLDLNLGISLSSDSFHGSRVSAAKTSSLFQFEGGITASSQEMMNLSTKLPLSWGSAFSSSSPNINVNHRESGLALQDRFEAARTAIWQGKALSSAASSGFSPAVTPCLYFTQRSQFP